MRGLSQVLGIALLAVPGPARGDDALIASPQTLSASAVGVAAAMQVQRENADGVPPSIMGSSLTIGGLALAASYGATDELTVGVAYSFDLVDDSGYFPSNARWKGPLDVNAAFAVVRGPQLRIAVGVDGGTNLGNTEDRVIHVGASAKYLLTPAVAIYTGNPLLVGPAGQQLSFVLATHHPINLGLPIGIAIQPTPCIFAFVDTTLASLSIWNSPNTLIFSDFIPVDVGAMFRASKDLDVGVLFSDDLKNAGDFYTIGLTARLYKH